MTGCDGDPKPRVDRCTRSLEQCLQCMLILGEIRILVKQSTPRTPFCWRPVSRMNTRNASNVRYGFAHLRGSRVYTR